MCIEQSMLRKKAVWHLFRHWYCSLCDQLPRNVHKCTIPMTNDL